MGSAIPHIQQPHLGSGARVAFVRHYHKGGWTWWGLRAGDGSTQNAAFRWQRLSRRKGDLEWRRLNGVCGGVDRKGANHIACLRLAAERRHGNCIPLCTRKDTQGVRVGSNWAICHQRLRSQ